MKSELLTPKYDVHDAFSDIISAKDQLDSDLSNWNGDNDGPKEKANDRFEREVQRILVKLYDNMPLVRPFPGFWEFRKNASVEKSC